MSDKVFLDSNILIYCYTTSDKQKQLLARKLATGRNACISMQVLSETTNVLHRKYNIAWSRIGELITDFENNFSIQVPTTTIVRKACQIAERYKFSFFDSMIIASATECNCSILYSEDLQNKQIIDNGLQIINPFL